MRYEVDFPSYVLEEAMTELAGRLSPETIERTLRLVLESIRAHVVRLTVERLDKDPTGALANSWAVQLDARGPDQWEGIIGTERPYAQIHNDGDNGKPKTIYPRGNWLAIPVGKTPRGMWPSEDSTDLIKIASRKPGTALLVTRESLRRASKKKGRTKWDVRYVLRKEVTIQPTFYVNAAIEAATPEAEDVLLALVEDALKAAASQ
tara:strand:- start:8168 stop:8785 length:618 start_codon:yes stop_codon:yes gene_type:complete